MVFINFNLKKRRGMEVELQKNLNTLSNSSNQLFFALMALK